jgi:hypothetical protein
MTGTDAYAEHASKDLMCAYISGTDAYAEHTCQELIRVLKLKLNDAWLPQKFKKISFYFSPKFTYPNMLHGVKIMIIRVIENLTLRHL